MLEPRVEETAKNLGVRADERRGRTAAKRSTGAMALILRWVRRVSCVASMLGPW